MKLFERVSRLMTANVNHMIDEAENPEVMIKQLVRDMEGALVELRRETVGAVAHVKHLGKQIASVDGQAVDLERKASLALEHDDEDLARQVLSQKLQLVKTRDGLAVELQAAEQLASRLKDDMLRMEEQAQLARRKQDQLIRRKRAAEAQLRTQQAARRSAEAVANACGRVGDLQASQTAFDGYAHSIDAMEAEAEAARELQTSGDDAEQRLRKLVEKTEVDEELERLRQAAG